MCESVLKAKFLFLIFGLCFLVSCKGKNGVTAERSLEDQVKAGPVIGFSIDTLALERWQRDLDTFMSTASNLGAEVIVQNAGNDSIEQNKQLLYLASQNVDCVVILPRDSKSIKEGLERLKAQNIPIISYDRLILDADITLYMTIDSEKVGYLMGNRMRNITQKTSWALILGDPDDNNMNMIETGLWKALQGSDINIIDNFYTLNWNYDLSRQHAFDMITSGLIPDAIICGNDAVAESVISVFESHLNKKHIPVCGQDADIAACKNIVLGKQDFTIYKPISDLAQKTAENAVKLAKGVPLSYLVEEDHLIDNLYKKVPYVMLDPVYVDKENIDEIIIDSGFHTYNEVYQ
ncbi:MAG: substrate-binding domain-containing protein [Treponema sp.]|nr:substrate-binding domain-containing protein [Treponema sp.]